MKERLRSSMPSHRLMPHGILRIGRKDEHRPNFSHRITRQPARQSSADDPYHAGFKDGVSGHTVIKPSGVNHRPWEYICFAEAVPGEKPGKLFVTAQLREVTPTEKFVSQSVKRPGGPLLFTARARIGLNQEGFFTIVADGRTVIMRVGNAAGPLQEVSVTDNMPSYDPTQLVVEYRNSLIIASA